MSIETQKTTWFDVDKTKGLRFRLRPVATPTGFRYHVDARPDSLKYAPQWQQVTKFSVSKEAAQKFINARSGR